MVATANRFMFLSSPIPDQTVQVTAFRGTETLGRPFQFQIDLVSEQQVRAADIVDQDATLTVIQGNGRRRFFSGRVFTIEALERRGRLFRTRLTVRPWMFLLSREYDCRTFHPAAAFPLHQNDTVPSIVQEVWRSHGFGMFRSKLSPGFPRRELTVQYRESTFNFLQRLMEEEGIYYFFDHQDQRHDLVLCDSLGNHEPRPGDETIRWDPTRTALTGDEHLSEWVEEREFSTTSAVLADFDFTKPRTPLSESGVDPRELASRFEMFDYPGGFSEPADGERLARVRAEELAQGTQRFIASGNVRALAPGFTFRLTGPTAPNQRDTYLVVSATYDARSDIGDSGEPAGGAEAFTCRVVVQPVGKQFRPARTTERPRIAGPQTAIVCGKEGEEIETDPFGRIKLRFHWDRRASADERSSPFVRVAQTWAGRKWGALFTPRIGHEVVVEFLEGDAAKPIVVGSVYNQDNLPPYALPADKTVSGIKTDSSKGSAGFNEIRFQDLKGHELLSIQAEKDRKVLVKNNNTETVHASETISIGGSQTESIGGNQTLTVGKDESITIGVNRSETVGSNETIIIGAARSEMVGAAESVIVGANRTHTVGAIDTLAVAGARLHTVAGAELIGIGGAQGTMVGAVHSLLVTGAQITGIGGARLSTVGGNDTLSVGDKLKIEAASEIEIKTGSASIKMTKDGKIQITGTDITIKTAADGINIDPSGLMKIKGPMVRINT